MGILNHHGGFNFFFLIIYIHSLKSQVCSLNTCYAETRTTLPHSFLLCLFPQEATASSCSWRISVLTSVFVNNTRILSFLEFRKAVSVDFIPHTVGFGSCACWLCHPHLPTRQCVRACACLTPSLVLPHPADTGAGQ